MFLLVVFFWAAQSFLSLKFLSLSFFAGTLFGVVVWLSVDSIVSLFSVESSSVQSNYGVCAGAGIDAELVGWSVTFVLVIVDSI